MIAVIKSEKFTENGKISEIFPEKFPEIFPKFIFFRKNIHSSGEVYVRDRERQWERGKSGSQSRSKSGTADRYGSIGIAPM